MKELYPFTGRYLDLEGLRYHYLDEGASEGAAEPVVMVHGNPTWSFYYRNLVLALRDRHRVIVPDHIGCGLSDKPGDDRYEYTLERRVADLERLLDETVPEGKVNLVLHDWGGMIGMAWAVRHPERVARLVLLNTAAFHLPAGKPFPWALWLCRNSKLGGLLVRGCNAFALAASWIGTKRQRLPRAVRRAYRAPYDSWTHRIATLRFVQDIPLRPRDRGYDLVGSVAAGLAAFRKTPVLIGWGLKDFVFDHWFLEEWGRRLPQAEVHRFPDCGHYILEDAREELEPLIREFLGGAGGRGE